jgi:hypothetical protein
MNRLRRILPGLALALALAPALRAQAPAENIPLGSHVTLVASTDGHPSPTVEWFKDGKKIGDSLPFALPDSSPAPVFECRLVLGVIGKDAAGSYVAKATNYLGSASSEPYVITTNTAPTKPTIRVIAVKPSQVTVEVQPGVKVIQGGAKK